MCWTMDDIDRFVLWIFKYYIINIELHILLVTCYTKETFQMRTRKTSIPNRWIIHARIW